MVNGDVRVPGDKSITHRALMLAAAANGTSVLTGLLAGEDCQSTARALRSLGSVVPPPPKDGGEMIVQGKGLSSWTAPAHVLDCGNSGTTARLMMGLLAGRNFAAKLTGDDSLKSRPMRRITVPLVQMGAKVRELGDADRLPLEMIGGSLRSIAHISPHASAQIKSAVLLAGISGGVPVSVLEPYLSRDHTERMLSALGSTVDSQATAHGWLVRLQPGNGSLAPLEMRIPGDPSSSAFILALALLSDQGEVRVRGVCVNPTRIGLLPVIRRMGGDIRLENERVEGGEPIADLIARPSDLQGTSVGAEEIPSLIDEIPILTVLASRAQGETRITGAAELRNKESDRIAVLAANLSGLGVEVEEHPDGLTICGSDRPAVGAVKTHLDHRIAMAFGVLAQLGDSRIVIDRPDVVDVSFPGFWSLLQSLTRSVSSTDEART